MAESVKEELKERLAHQPKIQVSMPKYYGVPSVGGRWEKVCPHSGLKLSLTKEEWDNREEKFQAEAEAERLEKLRQQQEEQRKKNEEYIAALPKEQKFVRSINRAKKVLGRNNLIGYVLRNHDVVSEGGIIIPSCVRETDRDFEEVMIKSTMIRVTAVSDFIDEHQYPWLVEAKRRIESGRRGPIIEINPGSGAPRRGENGEAYLFINAQWCWLEYPEPEDNEDGSACAQETTKEASAACSGGTTKKPTSTTTVATWLQSLKAAWPISSRTKNAQIQPGRN